MKAIRCDRCKKYVNNTKPPEDWKTLEFSRTDLPGWGVERTLHLCSSCHEQVLSAIVYHTEG